MPIIKRPPNDDFTFRLFFKLTHKVKVPHDPIYIWSPVFEPGYERHWPELDEKTQEYVWKCETELDYRNKLMESITKDFVVLAIKDHLTTVNNFNPWVDKTPIMVEHLSNMFEYYSDKKFILITSLENLDQYIQNDNVKIVSWGGDITNQQRDYINLAPLTEKNLDSKLNFVSLNRNNRSHRAVLLSLLYGLDLDKHGLISCMFKDEIVEIFEYLKWDFTDTRVKEIVEQGFTKLKSATMTINDDKEIYHNYNNDNVTNFKNKLMNYYREIFVEIITETSFTEKCYLITEKTLNSIYGMNFPILMCGKGSVELLRQIGFDMFDDIIDHSYDTIDNPIDRLYTAISNNSRLLADNKYVKDIWVANKSRFENNIAIAKTQLYTFYSERADKQFNKALKELE
jgi:hypothetical protein